MSQMRCTTLVLATFVIVAATAAHAQTPPQAATASGFGFSRAEGSAWSTSQEAPRAPRAAAGVNLATDAQAPVAATSPTPSASTVAPQAPRPGMRTRGQLLNVRVEFTITDQTGTKPPVKKMVSMVVADGESSRIRTNVEFSTPYSFKNDKGEVVSGTNRGVAPLSVDVNPVIEGNKVRLDFSVEYTATDIEADGRMGSKTTVSERLAAVLDSGIPLIVAQSSDAYGDRKVTVEIKATVLK